MPRYTKLTITLLGLLGALTTACGGGVSAKSDPVAYVPSEHGVRAAVAAASHPRPARFPASGGRTPRALAAQMTGGPTMAMASSVVTTGTNRLAFGVIDRQGRPVYGPTAVYVARTPDAPADGPYVAPADVLLTLPRYRSQQAATASDPFVAVYAGQVPFRRPGAWVALSVTRRPNGSFVASTSRVNVITPQADAIPEVGQRAPAVHTDTLATVRGIRSQLTTRIPPDDMGRSDFADVVGKKPVALLISTPQLCQSRVCGPVTDIELQMQAKYGDRMTFIHQEVYADNNPAKGLRRPLQELGLRTEPWLFVVNRKGVITARLDGSIGVRAFEAAVKTGL